MKNHYLLLAFLGCLLLVACNTAESGLHSKPDVTEKKGKAQKHQPNTTAGITDEQNNPNTAASEIENSEATNKVTNTGSLLPDVENVAGIKNVIPAQTGTTETISYMQAEEDNMARATSARVSGKSNKPVMTFDYNTIDFGTIVTGSKVQHSFAFTNTGAAPLIIHDASGSCGCTVPEIPLEPIAPGETGTIVIHYDSTGKIGLQNKTITVQTNALPATHLVYIKAVVVTENMVEESGKEGEKE
ncbi:MAG TPA: DUF1573 domain-containing protein [Chitinophagales bacterium]|nr:DUF1573 domain-containing protein [Chitinophagales bacterium]HRK28379.1 DUF1573 domain-containing protein [Chitinophagales bacterium]